MEIKRLYHTESNADELQLCRNRPQRRTCKKCGDMLRRMGYRVIVFDVSNPEKSVCYNPFVYFRNDMDVLDFVNNFFSSQEQKDSLKENQFWDDMAKT